MKKKINELQDAIDRLGELKELKDKFAKEYEELKAEIERHDLPVGTTYGNQYQLDISERVIQDIDPLEAQKALGKNFLNCVKVVKEAAEQYLSKVQLNSLIVVKGTRKVFSVKKRR